jgi:tetratricopeptide (TPR) repeat protein
MISLICERCQKRLKFKEGLAGKRIKCPGCGHVQAAVQSASPPVEIPAEPAAIPPIEPTAPSASIDLMALAMETLALFSPAKPFCDQAVALRQQWQDPENIDKARALFYKAVEADANYWQAHYGLGEILLINESKMTASEVNHALLACRRAAELAPRQVEPPLQIAATLAAINLPQAVEFYLYAIQVGNRKPADTLYPADWQAQRYWEFAIRAAQGGLNELATDAFRRALALSADNWNYKIDLPQANACLQAARMFPVVRRYGSPSDQTIHLPMVEPLRETGKVPATPKEPESIDSTAEWEAWKANLKGFGLLQLAFLPIMGVALYAGCDSMKLYLVGDVTHAEVVESKPWGDVRYRFQVGEDWYSHSEGKPGEDNWAKVPEDERAEVQKSGIVKVRYYPHNPWLNLAEHPIDKRVFWMGFLFFSGLELFVFSGTFGSFLMMVIWRPSARVLIPSTAR